MRKNMKRLSAIPFIELKPQHLAVSQVVVNALIGGLWLWLYRAVFDYLAIIFTREDFRTNQILLIGVIILLVAQIRKEKIHLQLDATPQLFRPALLLVLVCSFLYLLVERFLDINTISASLFGLASYGLLGLWINPARWRRNFPAALVLVGILPFGEHMQTFIGYPMRLLTASIVRDGLASAGITSIGIDTILILENSVAQIDVPCSGVKSLWTGTLFLLAATWIEGRAINGRWFVLATIMTLGLLATNLARVGILVVVGQVANLRLLAEMLHVPLGVLGFSAVCALIVFLLRRADDAPIIAVDPSLTLTRPGWLSPVLAFSIFVLGLLYTPRPHTGLSQPPPTIEFPANLVTQALPLKPDEIEWLMRDGAESAQRLSFQWRGISGSMMFVTSATWRAHHRPERCFEVFGLSLNDLRTYLVAPDFPVRFVALGDQRGQNILSATYWFQSATRLTDDYGTRIWADLVPHRERWILVTILFDRVVDPSATDVHALYLALRDAVARHLTGEGSP